MNELDQKISNYMGNKLKQLRTEKGWTQLKTAQQFGVTLQTYRTWEKAKISFNTTHLFKIMKAFDIPIADIFENFEEKIGNADSLQ